MADMNRRRVVVTGLGTVNPLGNDIPSFWEAMKAGKSGVGPITKFDAQEFPARIAAEVKDFKASDHMDRRDARKMAHFTQFAAAASLEALKDAGLDDNYDKDRTAIILGNGIGGFEIIEEAYYKLIPDGPGRIPPMTIPKLIPNEAPGNIAILTGINGPAYSIATACASATDAIGDAIMRVRAGMSDVVITGGTEAAITRLGIGGFCVLQTLSTRNDDPEAASRPFDKDRDGFIMGEGAGILVIEELEHAKARGAKIYCELAGFGASCDANHLTSPHPEAVGAIKAMKGALADAGMAPEDIDYINAHGTSTPVNDPIETRAIKGTFGDHAYKLKVSSTKSMTGHLVGAAGGVEAIASILGMRDGFYPATINLDEADPECDLDYVANQGVEAEMNAFLSNSLGFGGHNAVLIGKKFTG